MVCEISFNIQFIYSLLVQSKEKHKGKRYMHTILYRSYVILLLAWFVVRIANINECIFSTWLTKRKCLFHLRVSRLSNLDGLSF